MERITTLVAEGPEQTARAGLCQAFDTVANKSLFTKLMQIGLARTLRHWLETGCRSESKGHHHRVMYGAGEQERPALRIYMDAFPLQGPKSM